MPKPHLKCADQSVIGSEPQLSRNSRLCWFRTSRVAVFSLVLLAGLMGQTWADDDDSNRREADRDGRDRAGRADGDDYRERAERFRDSRGPAADGRQPPTMRRDGQGGPRGPGDQRGQGGPRGSGDQRGPMAIPMFRALDRNADGRIDAGDLDLAVASLRTRDKDKDGQLTVQEMFSQGPGQMGLGMGRPGMDPRGRGPEGDRPGMGPGQMPSVEQMFSQLDRDGDGSISKDEAPGRMAENFDRIDSDGDGKASKEELQVARQRMMSMGQRGGRDGRGQSNDPAGGTRPRRPESE